MTGKLVTQNAILLTGRKDNHMSMQFNAITLRVKPVTLSRMNLFFQPGTKEIVLPLIDSLYSEQYVYYDLNKYPQVELSGYLPVWLRNLAVFPGKEGFVKGKDVVDTSNNAVLPAKLIPDAAVGRNDVAILYDSRYTPTRFSTNKLLVLDDRGRYVFWNDGKSWPMEFPSQPTISPLVFNYNKDNGFYASSHSQFDYLHVLTWYRY